MLFAYFLIDNPGMAEKRNELRPAHKDYLGLSKDQIYFAGPLWNDDFNKMLGSIFIVEQPDKAAAEAWLAEEPFTKNGIYGAQYIYGWQHLKGAREVKGKLCVYFHLDGATAPEKRGRLREQHVEYLEYYADNLFAAGPLYADSDKTEFENRIGSLFVVDFPDRTRADEWRAQEPYTRNDVYDRCWGYAYENLWRGE